MKWNRKHFIHASVLYVIIPIKPGFTVTTKANSMVCSLHIRHVNLLGCVILQWWLGTVSPSLFVSVDLEHWPIVYIALTCWKTLNLIIALSQAYSHKLLLSLRAAKQKWLGHSICIHKKLCRVKPQNSAFFSFSLRHFLRHGMDGWSLATRATWRGVWSAWGGSVEKLENGKS